jgi:hypothetical protein
MLNSGKYKEFIVDKLAVLQAEISSLTRLGLYNENLHCEYLIKNILNIVYDWQLENLNTIIHNYPSIDLGDFTNRVAVQVTSTKSSRKVNETLYKFFSHKLNDHFESLYIFVLTNKQRSYTIKQKRDSVMFFDEAIHIMDFTDIEKKLDEINNDQLTNLYLLFETEFSNTTSYLYDMNAISSMMKEFTKQQIENQKRTNKYIPSIFIETSEIKDLTRYFIVPRFYYRAYDNISYHKIVRLNKMLSYAEIENIEYETTLPPAQTMDEIIECSNSMVSKLTRLKETADTKIKELQKVSSTLFKQNPTPKKAWKTAHSSYLNSYFLDESIKQFQLISKHILLITSVAGKGKTNFLCDLIENVITKRGMDCMFFTGNELNGIDLDNIEGHMIRRTFKNHYFTTFRDFSSYYQKVFEMSGKYLFVVIDGLNEVNNLTIFPTKLCHFIETLLSYNFIKLILSCRSEFFTIRFNCITKASFSNEIHIFSDFNKNMTDTERKQLYIDYLKHFNIDIRQISDSVYDKLSSDPLLLRIFCEANNRQEKNVIHNLESLNKEHIFEEYYQRKISQIPNESQEPIPLRDSRKPIENVFNSIVKWMLNNVRYTGIDIETLNLTSDDRQILSKMVNEDILLRKDLSPSSPSEYLLNFTYDEFRDFLIARYLIATYTNINELSLKLDTLLVPQSPIFEGVLRFIFHISRKSQKPEFSQLLKRLEWYDDLFIQEIFQLDDMYIENDDLLKIEQVVRAGGGDSRDFILSLIYRANEIETPNLNIKLLLRILKSINEEQYDHIFGSLFYYDTGGYRMYGLVKMPVNDLIDSLNNIVKEKPSLNPIIKNYLELVIFMLLSADYNLKNEARMLLKTYLSYYKDEVEVLLEDYRDSVKIYSLKDRIISILKSINHEHI